MFGACLLEASAEKRWKELLSNPDTLGNVSAQMSAAGGDRDTGLMQVVGGVAEIKINGILTNTPDWIARYFMGGNVVYSDIISTIREAEQDASVKEIQLRVGSSPGGTVAGLIPAMDAIAETTKPIHAFVDDMAASGAYMLISQADSITATNEGTMLGSVGVVISYMVDDDVVDITNTDSPNKRVDPKTEAGKKVVRAELDSVHSLIAARVATGRKTTEGKVNKDFGQGSMLIAPNAKLAGMIDNIEAVRPAPRNRSADGGENLEANMTLEELKAKHPELYSAAVQYGVEVERERVKCYLATGVESGEIDHVHKALEAGTPYTSSVGAFYMGAAMRKIKGDARQDDEAPVVTPKPKSTTVAGVADETGALTVDEQKIVDHVAASMGE